MIKIIDGFFEKAQVQLAQAFLSNYSNYENYPPHLALHNDVDSLRRLEGFLGRKLVYTHEPMYRYYDHADNQPTYIHSDIQEGEFTTVVFLNKESAPLQGLAFWRHKETGLLRLDSDQDIIKFHVDGLDEGKWELVKLVQMEFNRAVIFDSRLFHARYPQNNWSTDINNTRLIKVMFTKELK